MVDSLVLRKAVGTPRVWKTLSVGLPSLFALLIALGIWGGDAILFAATAAQVALAFTAIGKCDCIPALGSLIELSASTTRTVCRRCGHEFGAEVSRCPECGNKGCRRKFFRRGFRSTPRWVEMSPAITPMAFIGIFGSVLGTIGLFSDPVYHQPLVATGLYLASGIVTAIACTIYFSTSALLSYLHELALRRS